MTRKSELQLRRRMGNTDYRRYSISCGTFLQFYMLEGADHIKKARI